MDFDRCSGAFSNARFIGMPFRAILGGGIAFSGDGNKLLVNTQLSIQEADLTLPNPVLDTIVPSLDIAGASLLLMQYAPNGKIDEQSGRTKAYHVINTPDDPDIGFEQRGLSLPVYAIRSLPNYPNYRLYDLPGVFVILWALTSQSERQGQQPFARNFRFSQSFLDKITVTLNSDLPNTFFSLYDQTGRLVLSANLVDETTKLTGIKLPVGVYFSEVKEGESGRKVRGKLIKAGN
jgi:hypothetical protein